MADQTQNSSYGSTDPYSSGVSNVNNAVSQGNSQLGSFDPSQWAASTQSGLNNITSSQAAGNNDIVNAFKTQIANQPSATDYYNQGMTAFNVPQLQQTSNNLNNAMLNTPNSNLQAARGFNFDQNQIDQKNSQDLQRLGPAAQAAQNNASTAQQNAIAYQNAGLQQNQMNMTPLQQQATSQAALYAAQMTGFGQQQQQELAGLQAKMTSGVQLSAQEMQSYQALTSSEQSYNASIAQANATVKAAQIGQQSS